MATRTIDFKPVGFIVHSLTAGDYYQLPAGDLSDQKTFVIAKVEISIEGDQNTRVRYRVDPDALKAPHDGVLLYDGDTLTLLHPTAVKQLVLYAQAVGAGTTLRITLYK